MNARHLASSRIVIYLCLLNFAKCSCEEWILHLIDHIDVYHTDRVNGEITQDIRIYYNYIGAFDVPDWKNIPDFDILLETRKGVALNYSPTQRAG